MDPEIARVRWASRGASLALAALALLLAANTRAPLVSPYGGAGEAGIIAMIEPEPEPQARATRRRPVLVEANAMPDRGATGAGAAVMPLLWINTADGRILFPRREQYQRCLAARRRGVNEADCPSPSETRELAYSANARG